MEKYQIESAFLTETYDLQGFETREKEVNFPTSATIEELITDARIKCRNNQTWNEFYSGMIMDESPSVSTDIKNGEGYIDITFNFNGEDFATDMRVAYVVREVAE